jgi:tRNA(Ile)-lysidine synthetase-like protein
MILCKYKLLSEDKLKIFVAVSGGIDSIAACHFLRNKIDGILHVNHNYIPQDNEIEVRVKNFAAELKLPIVVTNGQYKKASCIENDCRNIRLDAIRDLNGPIKIVYAHHLNDCVEQYFLNFLKGKVEYTPIKHTCNVGKNKIIRPFLLTKKSALEEYVYKNNLYKYVIEDELNFDIGRMRNWTRQVVLPVIKERYKGLEKVVFKKMSSYYERTL